MDKQESIKRIKDLLFEIQLSKIKEKAEKNVWSKKRFPSLPIGSSMQDSLWLAHGNLAKYKKERTILNRKVNRIWENAAEITIEHFAAEFEKLI